MEEGHQFENGNEMCLPYITGIIVKACMGLRNDSLTCIPSFLFNNGQMWSYFLKILVLQNNSALLIYFPVCKNVPVKSDGSAFH